MDTALAQKFPSIVDRYLAKANCTGNRVCTSCDTVVLGDILYGFLNLMTKKSIAIKGNNICEYIDGQVVIFI